MKRLALTKVQLLVTYLGQKVIYSGEGIDCGVMVYPMGAVGELTSIESDGKGGAHAVVIFDNDPLQDCVPVPIDDLMPTEFLPEGYSLVDVQVRKSSESIRI